MTKDRVYFLDTHAWRGTLPLPNKDGTPRPGNWYVLESEHLAEIERLKACWAEALGNYARQNREVERLQAREVAARALLEPLADCDQAIRDWLRGAVEPKSDIPVIALPDLP